MSPRFIVVCAFAVALPSLVACGAKSGSSTETQTTTAQSRTAQSSTAPAQGSAAASDARIVLTGSLPLTIDTAVTQCDRAAPGHTLLSGYSVSFQGNDVLKSGGIHIPSYKGDGQYDVPVHPHSFAEDPLQISLNETPKLPHGSTLSQGKRSTLTVTISKNGHAGTATLKQWSTLYPDNGMDNGSISWTCAS